MRVKSTWNSRGRPPPRLWDCNAMSSSLSGSAQPHHLEVVWKAITDQSETQFLHLPLLSTANPFSRLQSRLTLPWLPVALRIHLEPARPCLTWLLPYHSTRHIPPYDPAHRHFINTENTLSNFHPWAFVIAISQPSSFLSQALLHQGILPSV